MFEIGVHSLGRSRVESFAQHFHGSHECDIKKDLKVYILQDNVISSHEKKEFYEDQWITRLDSRSPHGMNTNLKHFAKTYYELFD